MSEERFDRIDQRLDGIDLRLDGIDLRLDGIDLRLDGIDLRLGRIDQRLDGVDLRLDRLEAGQTELRTHLDDRFEDLRRTQVDQFEELRRHMGVLHEEALDRIAGTRESPATTTNDRPAELIDKISRRLDPPEALVPVVREPGATLQKHDSEIERLKRRRK